MDSHSQHTVDAILGEPAPRDLRWADFETMWKSLDAEVEQESGDRLAVRYRGHRIVFRRQHDGLVSIEDVERARHLLHAQPEPKGTGHLLTITIDAKGARLLDFDLNAQKVVDSHHELRDIDPDAHHLRTVERHTGRDDEAGLKAFFDELAAHLVEQEPGRHFVVIGHGVGKADVADQFVERLREKHPEMAGLVLGTGTIDLSAANDGDIEKTAMEIAGR